CYISALEGLLHGDVVAPEAVEEAAALAAIRESCHVAPQFRRLTGDGKIADALREDVSRWAGGPSLRARARGAALLSRHDKPGEKLASVFAELASFGGAVDPQRLAKVLLGYLTLDATGHAALADRAAKLSLAEFASPFRKLVPKETG